MFLEVVRELDFKMPLEGLEFGRPPRPRSVRPNHRPQPPPCDIHEMSDGFLNGGFCLTISLLRCPKPATTKGQGSTVLTGSLQIGLLQPVRPFGALVCSPTTGGRQIVTWFRTNSLEAESENRTRAS